MSAVAAVVRRELLIFSRYPSWILSLVIWPVLFLLVYLLGSRALTGPGGEGVPAFLTRTGTGNVAGYQFRLLAGTPMSPTMPCAPSPTSIDTRAP